MLFSSPICISEVSSINDIATSDIEGLLEVSVFLLCFSSSVIVDERNTISSPVRLIKTIGEHKISTLIEATSVSSNFVLTILTEDFMAILLPEADLLELFTFTISKASRGLILSFLVKDPPPKESVNSVPKVKEPPECKIDSSLFFFAASLQLAGETGTP